MEAKHHEDRDYSITPVDAKGKKGFASMLVIMLGFTFYTGTMLTGGQLGTNLTLYRRMNIRKTFQRRGLRL